MIGQGNGDERKMKESHLRQSLFITLIHAESKAMENTETDTISLYLYFRCLTVVVATRALTTQF